MKQLFDNISYSTSKITTKTYSTSFSIGIYCLHRDFRRPIYNVYGFVRFADEIVDSFHGHDKETLLDEFRQETYKAIERKISLNPILNSFQEVVHQYKIDHELIEAFFRSMKMDLSKNVHDRNSYDDYIYGSAEVVGLMCLKIFTKGNTLTYESLKPAARKLGAAFQKVNFLRDMKDDYQELGRVYFPEIDFTKFKPEEKHLLEEEIEKDFQDALDGIRQLHPASRFGVYVAYTYYKNLFKRIKATPPSQIMSKRISVPNYQKIRLLFTSYFLHRIRCYSLA
jgi:15-cis-phytoene synthase